MNRRNYSWDLPVRIEKRIGPNTYGRQRIIQEGDDLLIILHRLPAADQILREHKVFWRKSNADLECNGQPNGVFQFRTLIDTYEKKLEELDRRYAQADTSDELFGLIEELVPINRASTNIATTLQAAREAVPDDTFLLELRDVTSELQRNFEIMLSDAQIALEYRLAKNSEIQSVQAREAVEAQHRLNVLAAIFFPLTAVATIFGMNLSHGFEQRPMVFFWLVVVAGISLGFWMKRWVLRK